MAKILENKDLLERINEVGDYTQVGVPKVIRTKIMEGGLFAADEEKFQEELLRLRPNDASAYMSGDVLCMRTGGPVIKYTPVVYYQKK